MSRLGLFAAILLAPLCLVPGRDAPAAPRLVVSAELGPELDTNPARVLRNDDSNVLRSYNSGAQTEAPLLRAVTRGTISWQLGRYLVAATYGAGGKLYLTDVGRLSDELVQHASLLWGVRLGKGVLLRLDGGYYDAFLRQPQRGECSRPGLPCPPRRDFRTGRAGAAMELLASRLRGRLELGYSGLEFKPDGQYSFHGLVVGLGLRRSFTSGRGDATAEWSLGASYRATLRAFGGIAQLPPPCLDTSGIDDCSSDARRRDLNHYARIDLDYLANAAGTLFYSLEVNRSNSFGESYRRHAIGLQFTAPLPAKLFLTAQVVLQLSSFSDPLFSEVASQAIADIDVENRSRLLLHLARDISKRWSIALRYAAYVNESGTTSTGVALPGFFRQTVFLGVRFEYDSDG